MAAQQTEVLLLTEVLEGRLRDWNRRNSGKKEEWGYCDRI